MGDEIMAQEEFLDNPMPDIIAQWRHYFSILDPQPGDIILDVGCNSGDAERLLLLEYPGIRKIFGIENNKARHQHGLEKWKKDGSPAQIKLMLADARELPFPEGYFDRVFCVETLEWLSPPLQGLREIKRVLKPGGTALIVHSDFDTQVFNSSDKLLTRKIVQAFSDTGPNGQIGRELPGLCREAGFKDIHISVYTLIHTEWKADLYAYQAAHMMADWPISSQLVSTKEKEEWLADLETQYSKGKFFYSINRDICVYKK
jgi:ubiquinone/menaquinone biosynthesis C-methylase UbiE